MFLFCRHHIFPKLEQASHSQWQIHICFQSVGGTHLPSVPCSHLSLGFRAGSWSVPLPLSLWSLASSHGWLPQLFQVPAELQHNPQSLSTGNQQSTRQAYPDRPYGGVNFIAYDVHSQRILFGKIQGCPAKQGKCLLKRLTSGLHKPMYIKHVLTPLPVHAHAHTHMHTQHHSNASNLFVLKYEIIISLMF